MAEASGTLASLLTRVASAIDRVAEDLSTPERALSLLSTLGVSVPSAPESLLNLRDLAIQVKERLDDFDAILQESDEDSIEGIAKLAALGQASVAFFTTLAAAPAKLPQEFAAYPDLLAEIDFGVITTRL